MQAHICKMTEGTSPEQVLKHLPFTSGFIVLFYPERLTLGPKRV